MHLINPEGNNETPPTYSPHHTQHQQHAQSILIILPAEYCQVPLLVVICHLHGARECWAAAHEAGFHRCRDLIVSNLSS